MKQTSPTDPVPSNNRFQMEAAASIDSKNLDIIKDQMYTKPWPIKSASFTGTACRNSLAGYGP